MSQPPDPDAPRSGPLTFETDRGASRSIWIASLILVALIGWMGSGFVLPAAPEATTEEPAARAVASVVVEPSQAKPVTLTFHAEGQALPERDSALRATATGDVAEVLLEKGAVAEADQPIARIAATRAEADLARANEERTRAQRELDNASQLLERGVGTADRVSEARAALAAAAASVTSAEQGLADLTIRAPFPGRIETMALDVGEFVSAGEEIGRIVDNSPLTIQIQIPQQELQRIETGQTAEVSFITGQTREGTVTFVGTAASSSTRTFLAEIEVANETGEIPAGVSAEVKIPTGQAEAHLVPASIVSLDTDGTLGVKTVEGETVRFYPVEIAKAELEGIWLTGLPDTAQIITIGQGFVQAGERVDPQPPTDPGAPDGASLAAGDGLPDAGGLGDAVETAASDAPPPGDDATAPPPGDDAPAPATQADAGANDASSEAADTAEAGQ